MAIDKPNLPHQEVDNKPNLGFKAHDVLNSAQDLKKADKPKPTNDKHDVAKPKVDTKDVKITKNGVELIPVKLKNGELKEVRYDVKTHTSSVKLSDGITESAKTLPNGDRDIKFSHNGVILLKAHYDKAKKELDYSYRGIQHIDSAQTSLAEFSKLHPHLAPNTVVKLANGDHIRVTANGTQVICDREKSTLEFKLADGKGDYVFKKTLNGVEISVNGGKFVSADKLIEEGVLARRSDGSVHIVNSGWDVGNNLGHFSNSQELMSDGKPYRADLSNGNFADNSPKAPFSIKIDSDHDSFLIENARGQVVGKLNYDTDDFSCSAFSINAAGIITLADGDTINPDGKIFDSYGNCLFNPNTIQSDSSSDSSQSDDSSSYTNTNTVSPTVDAIVSVVDDKLAAGTLTVNDLAKLQSCLASISNAMDFAKLTNNISLEAQLSSCQSMLENVIGNASSSVDKPKDNLVEFYRKSDIRQQIKLHLA